MLYSVVKFHYFENHQLINISKCEVMQLNDLENKMTHTFPLKNNLTEV